MAEVQQEDAAGEEELESERARRYRTVYGIQWLRDGFEAWLTDDVASSDECLLRGGAQPLTPMRAHLRELDDLREHVHSLERDNQHLRHALRQQEAEVNEHCRRHIGAAESCAQLYENYRLARAQCDSFQREAEALREALRSPHTSRTLAKALFNDENCSTGNSSTADAVSDAPEDPFSVTHSLPAPAANIDSHHVGNAACKGDTLCVEPSACQNKEPSVNEEIQPSSELSNVHSEGKEQVTYCSNADDEALRIEIDSLKFKLAEQRSDLEKEEREEQDAQHRFMKEQRARSSLEEQLWNETNSRKKAEQRMDELYRQLEQERLEKNRAVAASADTECRIKDLEYKIQQLQQKDDFSQQRKGNDIDFTGLYPSDASNVKADKYSDAEMTQQHYNNCQCMHELASSSVSSLTDELEELLDQILQQQGLNQLTLTEVSNPDRPRTLHSLHKMKAAMKTMLNHSSRRWNACHCNPSKRAEHAFSHSEDHGGLTHKVCTVKNDALCNDTGQQCSADSTQESILDTDMDESTKGSNYERTTNIAHHLVLLTLQEGLQQIENEHCTWFRENQSFHSINLFHEEDAMHAVKVLREVIQEMVSSIKEEEEKKNIAIESQNALQQEVEYTKQRRRNVCSVCSPDSESKYNDKLRELRNWLEGPNANPARSMSAMQLLSNSKDVEGGSNTGGLSQTGVDQKQSDVNASDNISMLFESTKLAAHALATKPDSTEVLHLLGQAVHMVERERYTAVAKANALQSECDRLRGYEGDNEEMRRLREALSRAEKEVRELRGQSCAQQQESIVPPSMSRLASAIARGPRRSSTTPLPSSSTQRGWPRGAFAY